MRARSGELSRFSSARTRSAAHPFHSRPPACSSSRVSLFGIASGNGAGTLHVAPSHIFMTPRQRFRRFIGPCTPAHLLPGHSKSPIRRMTQALSKCWGLHANVDVSFVYLKAHVPWPQEALCLGHALEASAIKAHLPQAGLELGVRMLTALSVLIPVSGLIHTDSHEPKSLGSSPR